LNKNTRWALAIVGVVILIVAAFVIGTSKDDTKTDAPEITPSTSTPSTGAVTSKTGPTGATGSGPSSGGNNSGGASPTDPSADTGGSSPDNGSGGASPDEDQQNGTGGASTSSYTSAPLLTAGAVKAITVDKGDTVYLRARSATADELHIHGYDYKVELPAGKVVKYKFKANIDGAFVMEFENAGKQVAALKVSP
jgi:hypothetical protein